MPHLAKGDRVVVFGGSGFLGSHTADALSAAGYRVRIFDIHPSRFLRSDQEMVVGDIQDLNAVMAACDGCAAVLNFSAIADIAAAGRDPVLTARINVLGTVNTLEAARRLSVARFVFASTVYVYSNHGGFYRASKQACERFIETYGEEFGLPFTILRYGTLYGRRAGDTNRIYKMINQALRENIIDYPGSGSALREFIHVQDAAVLTVRVMEADYIKRHLIITGQERLRVFDVAKMIQEMLPKTVELRFRDGEPEGHYEITPYAFNPKLGHKLVPDDYVDLGQGLLDCIMEQYNPHVLIESVKVPRGRERQETAEEADPALAMCGDAA